MLESQPDGKRERVRNSRKRGCDDDTRGPRSDGRGYLPFLISWLFGNCRKRPNVCHLNATDLDEELIRNFSNTRDCLAREIYLNARAIKYSFEKHRAQIRR